MRVQDNSVKSELLESLMNSLKSWYGTEYEAGGFVPLIQAGASWGANLVSKPWIKKEYEGADKILS